MDRRLIPLNGLLALLNAGGAWPRELHAQGLRPHLLEAQVFTSLSNAVADAILFREGPDLVVLCEAKSGRNISEDQARKYAAADPDSLRRAGTMPGSFRRGREPAVACMFVGLEEARADLETALTHLGINAPLLTIGRDRVRLSDTSAVHGLDDFDLVHEQIRMLGRERQADLDREAQRFALADLVRRERVARVRVRPWLFRRVASMLSALRGRSRAAKPGSAAAASRR